MTSDTVDIVAVNQGRRIALDSDDNIWHVEDWLDSDGDNCDPDDPDAVMAIATFGGKWICIDLRDYDRRMS